MLDSYPRNIYDSLIGILPRKKDFLDIKIRNEKGLMVIADYATNQIIDHLKDQDIPEDTDIHIVEENIASFTITDEENHTLEMVTMNKMVIGVNSPPFAIGYITLSVGYSKVLEQLIIGVGKLYPEKEDTLQ